MTQHLTELPWVSPVTPVLISSWVLTSNLTQPVLHPGLKLEYFRQHDWEKEWIEQAEKMVHEEYAANYEKAVASEGMSVEATPVQVCDMPSHLFSDSLT